MKFWDRVFPSGSVISILGGLGFALWTLAPAAAAPEATGPHKIGDDLYAFISADDASCNASFLVGPRGILVVDTGFNQEAGERLLRAIREVSDLPVRIIINTHYHPDHQAANAVVGPDSTVISTGWTRARTRQFLSSQSAVGESAGQQTLLDLNHYRLADITFSDRLTLHLGEHDVEVFFQGKAHTSGDALVYFPDQRAIATGDLFLTRSCPAMDQGSVSNWVVILDAILARPLETVIPGHFELSSPKQLRRFRNYLADLIEEVGQLRNAGASLQEVRRRLRLSRYADFRQYPRYHATFADNAEVVFRELEKR
ncbi:MAG: MBL fold metallo-hydrolase [Acidobacteriota bacterium]